MSSLSVRPAPILLKIIPNGNTSLRIAEIMELKYLKIVNKSVITLSECFYVSLKYINLSIS